MDLYPGNIILLSKEDICPIDGILLDVDYNTNNNIKNKYAKVSLSMLNGETNLHYINKIDKNFDINNYKNSKLLIYNDNIINAKVILNNNEILIKENNFVPAGSIIKSTNVIIWIVACGSEKRNYLKITNYNPNKISRIDKFVGMFMMKINAVLLVLFIIIISTLKMYLTNNYNISHFIQNWILFNGIIPFSIKIFLLLSRNLQSILITRSEKIIVNNSLQIDDINKIDKIITDKTGTLTKNELEFTHLIQKDSNKIINLESYNNNIDNINIDFQKCLGVCIHQSEGIFNTIEDKIIYQRYHNLSNRIDLNNNKITIHIYDKIKSNKFEFEYIDTKGLDFTFERKMSSKIVKTMDNKYYIYSKGSIEAISNSLTVDQKDEIIRLADIISLAHPTLRLLACAYKQLDITNEDHLLYYNLEDSSNLTVIVNQYESELNLLGLIGIRDNLQPNILETINKFKEYGIQTSMCTGDRKSTALAIAKEIGMIDNSIYELNDNYNHLDNIKDKTLLISGMMIEKIVFNPELQKKITQCKNFIGYQMMPDHKKLITSIFENNKKQVLTVGDGFNDIGMFTTSTISVAIQSNTFVESMADYTIKTYSNLNDLLHCSINSYYKNSKLINLTFCRSTMITSAIATYSLINYNYPLFNGFVLQAFNFAWLLPGLAYFTLYNDFFNKKYDKYQYYKQKYLYYTSQSYTIWWNIIGVVIGIVTIIFTNYIFDISNIYINDFIGIVFILILNYLTFITNDNNNNLYSLLSIFFGIFNFLFYMSYTGSLNYFFKSIFF